jgi:hypothetical protein
MKGWLRLAAASTLLIPLATYAEDRPTFESLWQAANAKPDHHTTDQGLAIVVDVPSEHAIYYFSKPGEEIHPGVVKRSIIETAEGVSIQTQGWSFAPDSAQPAFQRWLDNFKAQDAEMRKNLQKR